MLDGTAPHCRESDIPGAVTELVNLGQFWNSETLAKSKDEIILLNQEKKIFYKNAYNFLSAAGKTEENVIATISKHFNTRKAAHSIELIFDKYAKKGEKFETIPRIKKAFSTKGFWELEGVTPQRALFNVQDVFSSGKLYMQLVLKEAQKRCHKIIISYAPLDSIPDFIYIPQFEIGFELSNGKIAQCDARNVNVNRFIDKYSVSEMRKELKKYCKLRDELINEALNELSLAGKCHDSLEKIYVEAMDFHALCKFTKEFLKKQAF